MLCTGSCIWEQKLSLRIWDKNKRCYYLKSADPRGRKAWVCGRSLTGIAVSNPAQRRDVRPLWVLCVARYSSLQRTDHLSRGVLPRACVCVCVSECDLEVSIMKSPWPTRDCCVKGRGWSLNSKTFRTFSVIRGVY
jgi:hypothetical protein